MRWLLLVTACLFGCYTNIARVTQRLNTRTTGHESIFVSVVNDSGVGVSPEGQLRQRLREKGYQVSNTPESADVQLEVSINDAHWTPAAEMPGASGGSSSGGGSLSVGGGFRSGGGGGKDLVAAVVLIGVVLIVAAAVSAGEPKEWLTGTVLLKLTRKADPVPEAGAIDLKFSCVSDRPGTLRSAESEIVDRILEMF